MPSTTEDLVAKLEAASAVVKTLPVALLSQKPSAHFAENYNTARALALSLHPDVAQVSPPAITIIKDPSGPMVEASYVDIVSYSNELASILKPRAESDRHKRVSANIRSMNPPRRY